MDNPKASNTEINNQPTVPSEESTSSEKQTQSAEKKTASARDDTTSAATKSYEAHDEPWEPSLTGDELKILEELGLGVAVDITAKHPWARKSAFQAKSVLQANDLIVTNESNQFLRTSQQVESYSEMQAGLESSFRPDPSKPISVNIAAEFHRSNTRSKTIKGTTILTRTIAFRARDPTTRRQHDKKEEFEKHLHTWLLLQPEERKLVSCKNCGENPDPKSCQCPDCTYSAKTNHYCIDYLRELGGVTHYVSSITLGAKKYQIELNSTLFTSLSTSTGISADSIASASVKTKSTRKVFQSSSKEQLIGKLPQHDQANLRDLLKFRTKGEAVVQCTYNSLANLVSNPDLRKQLDLGIQEYIDKQKNGTRGPYHIATAEMVVVDEESKERKRLYWRVCRKEDPEKSGTTRYTYPIKCKAITRSDEASNFYLKPLSQGKGCERYFYIVTDPEDDIKSIDEVEPKHHTSAATAEPKHSGVQVSTRSKRVWEPQRYIQINPHTNCLEAVLVATKYKEHSAFKLKNPQDNMTYSLSRSQWLPEASLGSQPYIICCEGKSLQSWRKTKSVCVEKDDAVDTKHKGVKDDQKVQCNKKEGKKATNGQSQDDTGAGNDFFLNTESVIDSQDGNDADSEVENDPSVNNVQDDNEASNGSTKDQSVTDSHASNVKSKANNEYIVKYRECALSKIPFSDRLFITEPGHKT